MLIYTIILLVIGFPALYGISEMVREKQKKRKQLSFDLAYGRLVFEHKLSVEFIDMLTDKLIAIDRKNNKLVLINHSEGSRQALCISLLQVASSRIIEERDEQDQCIKKIYLELKLKTHYRHHLFCIYDARINPVTELPALSRKALYWNNRINIHKHPVNVSIGHEYVL